MQTPMDPDDILDDVSRVTVIDYATLSALLSGAAVDTQRKVFRRAAKPAH